jgi:hypothetical protein
MTGLLDSFSAFCWSDSDSDSDSDLYSSLLTGFHFLFAFISQASLVACVVTGK